MHMQDSTTIMRFYSAYTVAVYGRQLGSSKQYDNMRAGRLLAGRTALYHTSLPSEPNGDFTEPV